MFHDSKIPHQICPGRSNPQRQAFFVNIRIQDVAWCAETDQWPVQSEFPVPFLGTQGLAKQKERLQAGGLSGRVVSDSITGEHLHGGIHHLKAVPYLYDTIR